MRTTAHLWQVSTSVPPKDRQTYTHNVTLYVVTETLERAIALVREAEPTCTVHQVTKRNMAGPLLIDRVLRERLQESDDG
jgi:hypothetical protein